MRRPPPESAAGNTALWEDFVDIFVEPSQVFARRNGRFGPALLIVSVLAVLLFVISGNALQPIFDAEFARAAGLLVIKHPELTEAQIAQAKSIAERFQLVNYVFAFPVGAVLTGVAVWGAGHLVESQLTLKSGLMVAAYAQTPRLLQDLVNTVQGWLLDPTQLTARHSISLGPGRFANPDLTSPVLLAVLGRFDVFTLWVSILIGLGVRVAGRTSKSEAFLVATLVWMIGGAPAIVTALRQ